MKKGKERDEVNSMSAAMRGKEILSLRTENGKVYQTGPQKYRSVTYLDTIHYRDEKTGEYRLIDNRWIQDGEILHNQENPTLRVELGPGGISLRSTKGAELNWYLEGARPCTPRAEKQEERKSWTGSALRLCMKTSCPVRI